MAQMKILIFNWRDLKNPLAGGAEVFTHENAKRWVKAGHSVTLFASEFPCCKKEESLDGIKIVRSGGRLSVYWHAYLFYKSHSKDFDLVIDEVNTIPFFTPLYVSSKKFLLIHQLAREVWFYETSFPLSLLGYLLEPLYLSLYRNTPAITVSNSTKSDLESLGLKKIHVVPEGLSHPPLKSLPSKDLSHPPLKSVPSKGLSHSLLPKDLSYPPLKSLSSKGLSHSPLSKGFPPSASPKSPAPTLLYVGRLKRSKRVHDIISAFSLVHNSIPGARLDIAGSGDDSYVRSLNSLIAKYNLSDSVIMHGSVNNRTKLSLMRKSHFLLAASVREGWGLVVTEANSMGTPAVAYDVPGLRDSILPGKTGLLVSPSTPEALARAILPLLKNKVRLRSLSQRALVHSKQFTWDRSASSTLKIMAGDSN